MTGILSVCHWNWPHEQQSKSKPHELRLTALQSRTLHQLHTTVTNPRWYFLKYNNLMAVTGRCPLACSLTRVCVFRSVTFCVKVSSEQNHDSRLPCHKARCNAEYMDLDTKINWPATFCDFVWYTACHLCRTIVVRIADDWEDGLAFRCFVLPLFNWYSLSPKL